MASGSSLGAALMAHLRSYGSTPGAKASYRATGWHAQLRALYDSSRGSAAADAVGFNPNPTTVVRWLAEQRAPSKAYQAQISAAYGLLGGGFPMLVTSQTLAIYGRVRITDGRGRVDDRDRGNGCAPFRINNLFGDWDAIITEWDAGTLTAPRLETLYIVDVILNDLDGVSGTLDFPGPYYQVVAS